MEISQTFYPPRSAGLLVHALLALVSAGGGGFLFWAAMQQEGVNFILLLLAALGVLSLLPLAAYRWYALRGASYRVGRDGLRINWGLRAEDIPLDDIDWLRSAQDFGSRLKLPALRAPGALIGSLVIPDLGRVEFLASDPGRLLLLATRKKVFAISPEDPSAFARAFQEAIEMGSLTPLTARSTLPAAYLQEVWSDRFARALMLSGLVLGVLFLVAVSLAAAGLGPVSIGFDPSGQPLEAVNPERLLLLPVLGLMVYSADLIGGLFLYRREDGPLPAYLLWGSSPLTTILLSIAVLFSL